MISTQQLSKNWQEWPAPAKIRFLERLQKESAPSPDAPIEWQDRVKVLFPKHFYREFSDPHRDIWDWASRITPGGYVPPFVAIWPRDRGKSTHAECLVADLGARSVRRSCLYISGTQDQADKHVSTIASILESDEIAKYYPEVGVPRMGKNGSRTWKRSTLQASNGFYLEAIGLNKAVRGQKIDWVRPDLLVFDDVDARHDTEAAVQKKIEIITSSILNAGDAETCVTLFVQNLIHEGSIATSLSKSPDEVGAADFLMGRQVSGPHPAVEGLNYKMEPGLNGTIKWVVTEGRSLWEGFDLDTVQREINRVGPTTFEVESQHDIAVDHPDALLSSAVFNATRVKDYPDLEVIYVGADPSGGTGACGIVPVGKAIVGNKYHGYTLGDWTSPYGMSSAKWAERILACFHAVGADAIVVERNFGGDMCKQTIRTAVLYGEPDEETGEPVVLVDGATVKIIEVVASRGKEVRAQPVASLYELGRAHQVGNNPLLEKQWTRWKPGTKPSPNGLDAEVWAYTKLGLTKSTRTASSWQG